MRQGWRSLRRGVLAASLVLIAACTAQYTDHGYIPNDDELSRLEVGVDTRFSVAQLVGQPTSAGILDAGGWYYVESRYRQYGAREPEEIDREVVAISFDEAGRVANIERFGLEDGQVVVLSRRVTEENTRGVTFLRQLFGNLGNIDAGRFFGE